MVAMILLIYGIYDIVSTHLRNICITNDH